MATFSSEGGAFTKLPVKNTEPDSSAAEVMKKSKLAAIQDLIYLEQGGGQISEDLLIRTLQARFINQNYYVSFSFLHIFGLLLN